MSQFARVTSLDVLRDFKAALAEFAEQANQALSESQSDVQRTIWWIQNDRHSHWQREIKKRTDKLAQAKAELFKKQLESNDTRTSAIVERKHVAKAQAALDEAEEKLRRVKKWHQVLERELMLFKAGCAQVAGAVQGDIPVALGRMDRMSDSLEAYVKLAAPASAMPVLDIPRSDSPSEAQSDAPGEAKSDGGES
jgi:chromosome segregation ATPase